VHVAGSALGNRAPILINAYLMYVCDLSMAPQNIADNYCGLQRVNIIFWGISGVRAEQRRSYPASAVTRIIFIGT
jgi:hypothetical protein